MSVINKFNSCNTKMYENMSNSQPPELQQDSVLSAPPSTVVPLPEKNYNHTAVVEPQVVDNTQPGYSDDDPRWSEQFHKELMSDLGQIPNVQPIIEPDADKSQLMNTQYPIPDGLAQAQLNDKPFDVILIPLN